MRSSRLDRAVALAVALLGCGATDGCGGGVARAQTVRQDMWVANSTVRAAAVSGHTLYIGGDFTRVGPPTGSGVPVDAMSGDALAVRDGRVYVGGSFANIGTNKERTHLAAIDAGTGLAVEWITNSLTFNWSYSAIHCLALSGNTVYVSGDFAVAGGLPRNGAAA